MSQNVLDNDYNVILIGWPWHQWVFSTHSPLPNLGFHTMIYLPPVYFQNGYSSFQIAKGSRDTPEIFPLPLKSVVTVQILIKEEPEEEKRS